MRKLQITLIALFLAVAIAFCAVFLHDRLTADHTAPRIVSDGVPLEVSVNATDAELCAGLTAADDRDGDLTDRIIVRRVSQLTGANSAQATYTVHAADLLYGLSQAALLPVAAARLRRRQHRHPARPSEGRGCA